MHGFENNVQMLKQWAELHPQLPLPSNWKEFQQANMGAALKTMNEAPWIYQLLDGSAPAGLRAAALEGKMPTPADYQAHLQRQAQQQHNDEEAALKKLSEQADQMRRDRVGEKRFEAEQQLEQQRQASLQQQQEATREFEQRMARTAR